MNVPADRTVVVTGATGFIGRAVMKRLAERGWRAVVVSQDPGRARRALPVAAEWIGYGGEALEQAVARHGRVIRLAGQNPLEKRWTSAYKAKMWESRVGTADRMARAIVRSDSRDRVLVSAGGINIHASGGDRVVTETIALAEPARDSRACLQGQKGGAPPNSKARPQPTFAPNSSARVANASTRRVLPMPGGPWIRTIRDASRPTSPRVVSSADSSDSRPTNTARL